MTKARASAALGLLLVSLAAVAPAAAQWGQFRGPNGAGVDTASGYPVAFSPTDHVVWKAALPFAQSSPVVVGPQVYVTTSEGERLLTVCLDAATGRERWRREIKPRPLVRAVQGQQSRVADARRRRAGRRRLLRRRRARGLRARRHRALADAARALQELLRHGRLADHRRRRRASWSATRSPGRSWSPSIAGPDASAGAAHVPASPCRGRRRWCSRRAAAPTRS